MAISPNKAVGSDLAASQPTSLAKAAKGESRADFDISLGGAVARSGLTAKATADLKEADGLRLDLPTLREGAKGKEVGLLQQALNALGYGDAKIDQQFGPKTAEAAKAFQLARSLLGDGIVGNRQTWPALNHALAERHDDLNRLAEALGSKRSTTDPTTSELRQLNAIIAAFGERVATTGAAAERTLASDMPAETRPVALTHRPHGDGVHIVRTGENLADIARLYGLPVGALLASNPELTEPYLILPAQHLIIPRWIRDKAHRKLPRQLHPADPDGLLSNPNMNPKFLARVNAMIEQLRGQGSDVRVTAGFRTFTEQQERYDQGRTVVGDVLTDADAGHSWHNYGLAVDFALNDHDGDLLVPEAASLFWQHLGDVAIGHGALWGGIFGYPAHVEYHPGYGTDEGRLFIDDFESHGLERVWEKIDLALPPKV